MSSTTIIPLKPPVAGYVAPVSTNSELDDTALDRLLQQIVVGVTKLPGTNVFPRWQEDPPDQPGFNEDWAAVGQVKRDRDVFAALLHTTDPDQFFHSWDTSYSNEIIEVLTSFYGPNCQANSQLFTIGLTLAQNREAMFLNGLGLVEVQGSLIVPAIIKGRWRHGVDVAFRVRRQQIFTYPVPNIENVDNTIVTDAGFKEKASFLAGFGEVPFGIAPFGEGEEET